MLENVKRISKKVPFNALSSKQDLLLTKSLKTGMVENFEYSNFENFKTPNWSLCWELSYPLSAYSYCRSVIRPTGWVWVWVWGVGVFGDDVRECYDPVLVVPNCWELV